MTTGQIVALLFAAFGNPKDTQKQQIYATVFKSLPAPLLEKAVYKVISEWRFGYMPPPVVVLEAAKSLYDSKVPGGRVKTWAEAWHEINDALFSTPWGRTPKWSTPEIEAAVNSYGWSNLHTALESEMPTIRAQIRRFYEDSCNRSKETAYNAYILGEGTRGILGIPKVDKAPQGSAQKLTGALNS